ncbi:MAG: ABC transporter permease [Clostridium sp.]|nr:ABC transporter permease [Acetatifactor muris]MCM1527033.1 ABC transporter permease [Bacteroides sp.]MCM1562010.1 ABC transporter permease [Clostridium sp.]
MAEIVRCEFLKLKHSRICSSVFLATLVTPLLVLMLTIRRLAAGEQIPLFGFYDSAFVFLMPLFGPLIFSIAAAFLFGREYTEKTLKTIFAVPVSKVKFLLGKHIALFLSILILMVLTWAEILAVAAICNLIFGIRQLVPMVAIRFLITMIQGAVLLYAVITPIAYIAIRSRGFFAPVLIATVISLSDVILTGSPIAAYFPWTATYLLVTGQGGDAAGIAYLLIGAVCFISIAESVRYFKRTDIL